MQWICLNISSIYIYNEHTQVLLLYINIERLQSWKKPQNVRTRTFWGFWNVLKSAWPKKSRQKCVILSPSSILILNTSSILNPQSSILILIIILNTSSILNPQSSSTILIHNLELRILNSCSKIATKVRDLRPKMSSKVRDFLPKKIARKVLDLRPILNTSSILYPQY